MASLTALGPLLCLYRAFETHVLTGLSHAAAIFPTVRIDNNGPCEALMFVEPDGRPCWQLYLLPDSDYLAWDKLLIRLAGHQAPTTLAQRRPCSSACIDLAVGNPIWRASALRLHVLSSCRSPASLAASVAPLSVPGKRAAERLAGHVGAVLQPNDLAFSSP